MQVNAKYCPEIKCRWNSYSTYKFILWAWMMNEISVASAPVDMSHTAFYIHSVLYIFSAIFVGIPLVYSEICVSQYTNCDVISAWNFCPILRGVGYVLFEALRQIKGFYWNDSLKNLFRPVCYWGPRDKILFRSRNMFVPEIMTREFLYRQVKIHGYSRKNEINEHKRNYSNVIQDTSISPENTEWSALTSN
ncbi:uncharacterized protein LOC120633701 [Pararge aegeria]|uniref:uncharacterized protein LOC120633701 n=1 Tax=Pararge aegeria TaxID=116150 RepID=UPI0019D0BD19|nr:uncharacterized protein LOC120633701 [Pararge aegeria]